MQWPCCMTPQQFEIFQKIKWFISIYTYMYIIIIVNISISRHFITVHVITMISLFTFYRNHSPHPWARTHIILILFLHANYTVRLFSSFLSTLQYSISYFQYTNSEKLLLKNNWHRRTALNYPFKLLNSSWVIMIRELYVHCTVHEHVQYMVLEIK